jgi:hypothetical protein
MLMEREERNFWINVFTEMMKRPIMEGCPRSGFPHDFLNCWNCPVTTECSGRHLLGDKQKRYDAAKKWLLANMTDRGQYTLDF